jgi:hypothetical protein
MGQKIVVPFARAIGQDIRGGTPSRPADFQNEKFVSAEKPLKYRPRQLREGLESQRDRPNSFSPELKRRLSCRRKNYFHQCSLLPWWGLPRHGALTRPLVASVTFTPAATA